MIVVDTLLSQDQIREDQLRVELSTIALFERLDIGNGSVLALLDDAATQQDIDDALAISAAHDPGALDVKIWRYVDRADASLLDVPLDANYITDTNMRLHPTHAVVVDGEIRRVEYYADATMDQQTGVVTYNDLVIAEDFVYTRDTVGFARARTQTITWYREDGSAHSTTKTRVKLYEPDESMREGVRRRGNITDKLAMDLANWLMATQTQLANPQDRLDLGRAFMREYKIDFDMFVDASSSAILYLVRDNVEPEHAWLDDEIAPGVTIRDSILDALNIWNLTL